MIEVRNVCKKYPGSPSYSCSNLSFQVQTNQICGILGHNGAGKSTLLKMLATLYKPTEGVILIDGCDTVKDSLKVRNKIGHVFENPRLYDELTGQENITYAARLFKVKAQTAMERASAMYRELNVDFEHKVVKTYSKGMKQKISIIRTLIADPQVILFDEPTSGLDIESRSQIREYILRLRSQGKTVLMSSHIAEDIEKLCDKVVILHQGHIQEDTALPKLIAKYEVSSFEAAYLQLQKRLNQGEGLK